MASAVQSGELTLELDDIQGILLRGYGEKRHACYLLARIRDAAEVCAWLATVDVTTGVRAKRGDAEEQAALRASRHAEAFCINVAVSAAGLRAVGMTTDQLTDEYSHPFATGLASERSQHVLNDPPARDWAWSDRDVHAVIMVFGATTTALAEAEREIASDLGDAVATTRLDTTDLGNFEHFGFRDGISQPVVFPEASTPIGEFVLGYPDAHGEGGFGREELRFNGSYLVMRQMRQDVRGFWQYMASACEPCPPPTSAPVKLAAKMVGRWPSGEPLVRTTSHDPRLGDPPFDQFGFRDVDSEGTRCPLGSHIRRMNPRDWLFGRSAASARKVVERHRILRRGRPYGKGTGMSAEHMAQHPELIPDGERGLHFVCFQADIHRQFEFVQQTWANNPKFAGLCKDPDPLIGQFQRRDFTVQKQPVRHRATRIPTFVDIAGGGYFFLPGVRGLRRIAAIGAR